MYDSAATAVTVLNGGPAGRITGRPLLLKRGAVQESAHRPGNGRDCGYRGREQKGEFMRGFCKPHRLARLAGAVVLSASVLSVALGALSPGVAGAATGPATFTCSGGTLAAPQVIPAGTYKSVTVSDGFCVMQGTYIITGGLTVEPGAFLDAAVFFGFPPYDYGTPCNVFVTVSGGIRVGQDAAFYFGNSSDTGCPSSNNVVTGGISATSAESVVVHGTTISGGFTVQGGGGGTTCEPTATSPFGPYTNIEDSQVNGGVSVSDLSTCWTGIIRTTVNGTVKVNNNTMGDPDAIEIGLNHINGTLACSGNALAFPGPGGVPTNSFDGSPPNPNVVTGARTGQCTGL